MTTMTPAPGTVTGGVDTDSDIHVAAAVDHLGGGLGNPQGRTTPAGYRRLLRWLEAYSTGAQRSALAHRHGALSLDQRSRDYMTRRLSEGKTKAEVLRCIKRYIAREVFKRPTSTSARVDTGASVPGAARNAGYPSKSELAASVGTSRIGTGLRDASPSRSPNVTWDGCRDASHAPWVVVLHEDVGCPRACPPERERDVVRVVAAAT